jgi:hypothetical protein
MKTLEQVICISLTTTTFKVQIYPVSSMYSVYIPHIPVVYNNNMVADIFHSLSIGRVERVDFLAPHEHKPRIRRAFVHFHPYNTILVASLIQKHAAHEALRIVVDVEGHYWDLCENKHPVPESDLNIHQLAENLRILQASFESKIAELTEKLSVVPQMQEEIASLKSHIRYLEDPEWLTSTATGFDNGPLTTSMLNDEIYDEDSCCDDHDDEDCCESAAIHPCNASEYAAAINPCDVAFCQDHDDDNDNDNDNHDLCDDSFSDDITACTPTHATEMNTDNAANFRAEIEHHFVNEDARVDAPPIIQTKSGHIYDEAVDVDIDEADDVDIDEAVDVDIDEAVDVDIDEAVDVDIDESDDVDIDEPDDAADDVADDNDDVPTANDEYPFVNIGYADDGRIYVEYE